MECYSPIVTTNKYIYSVKIGHRPTILYIGKGIMHKQLFWLNSERVWQNVHRNLIVERIVWLLCDLYCYYCFMKPLWMCLSGIAVLLTLNQPNWIFWMPRKELRSRKSSNMNTLLFCFPQRILVSVCMSMVTDTVALGQPPRNGESGQQLHSSESPFLEEAKTQMVRNNCIYWMICFCSV